MNLHNLQNCFFLCSIEIRLYFLILSICYRAVSLMQKQNPVPHVPVEGWGSSFKAGGRMGVI